MDTIYQIILLMILIRTIDPLQHAQEAAKTTNYYVTHSSSAVCVKQVSIFAIFWDSLSGLHVEWIKQSTADMSFDKPFSYSISQENL